MIKDYFKLAWKNLSQRKLRSWLTMIGIFIGIAAIVLFISIGQGLENAIISQFSVAGSDSITVQASGTGGGPPGTGVVNPLSRDELEKIKQIGGTDLVVGRILESGKLEFNNIVLFGYAQSIPPGTDRDKVERFLNLKSEKGRLLKDGDRGKIVLGHMFLEDEMTDVFGKEISVGSKVLIQDKSFQVAGFLEKKGSFILDSAVIMNEQEMRDLFNVSQDEYDFFGVKVSDTGQIQNVKAEIEKTLRKARNLDPGEEDFSVQTSESAIKNLKDTLFAVQLFVWIIGFISVIVGGIGIMNSMYTAVLERTKEIGIMKAVGGTKKTIFTVFFVESGLLGMVGGIIGIILGVGLAELAVAIGRLVLGDLLSVYFSPYIIVGALVFSFVFGTIAGTLPALQAAKLKPVEALNYAK